jgi:predicted LPLAT superfamily acyltransferase
VHALDQRRGVLLLGSHHGSFDALRVLSLQRPDVQLRVLLDVGHNPAMTTLLHELNPTLAG